jgi:hypothetical protein
VKSKPGKRKRAQQDVRVAPSDAKAIKKLLGL